MNFLKTNPVGLDWYIQNAQTQLYNGLIDLWGLQEVQYSSYGRCYRNKVNDSYVAQIYNGVEYNEVYWDDNLTAISFFGIGEKTEINSGNKVPVHLVMFINLSKIKAAILHRPDEEARQDVGSVIGQNCFGLHYVSQELWLENVLREYPGSRRDERLKSVDQHPIHCFRFNYNLFYNPNKIC